MTCASTKCGAEIAEGSAYCPACGKKQGAAEPKKHLKRANNTGTVYKLSGRRRRPWVASKSKVIIGYYEKKTEAVEALNALALRPISERYNMTFTEVYEAWKAEHYQDVGQSTQVSYDIAYKNFEPLHGTAFRLLRTGDFQACVDAYAQKGKGRTHSSVSKVKQLIGQMSKWAMREDIATANYASFIRLPENKKIEKEIFGDEDIKKLKGSKDDAAKITLMLIYTGMRIGELFSLPAADVHEKYCIGGEKTATGRDRVIPFPEEVRSLFGYFKNKAEEGGLLMSGYEGNQIPNNFRKREYYPLLDSLGIARKSPHSTRHTFASMAVKSGIPPELLQKIIGHAHFDTTNSIYVHTDVDLLVGAVEMLSAKKKAEKRTSAGKAAGKSAGKAGPKK